MQLFPTHVLPACRHACRIVPAPTASPCPVPLLEQAKAKRLEGSKDDIFGTEAAAARK